MTTFTPRLTQPTDLSTWYGSNNSWNRFSSFNRGNCVWYSYGRMGECANKNIYDEFIITGGDGSGKYWVDNTWDEFTFTSGDIDIHLGDVLIYGGGTYGHVENVEKISGNKITTSYSIYGDTYAKSKYFGTREITIPSWNSNLGDVELNDGSHIYLTNKFIGYIHNPYVEGVKDYIFFRRGDYVKILEIMKKYA